MPRDMKAIVAAQFDLMGVTGETAPPRSQDPADSAAHEYSIASLGRAYWDKRCANAKDKLIKSFDNAATKALHDTSNQVAASETSSNVSLMSGQHYDITAQVKIGATYLDVQSLRVELMKKMNALEVDALFQRHTKRRNPSVTYIVSETINED